MESYQYVLMILLLLVTLTLSVGLFRKHKEAKALKLQLQEFRGQTEDQLFSRGKFSELGLMSAGITHEISNPLAAILGRIPQLVRMDEKNFKKTDFDRELNQIKKQAERIASVIHSVREYIYRDDEQTDDFISLTDILNNVLVFYGQRLKNHGIDLRLTNVDNVLISGHQGQFEQALLNLMSNAFDAIDPLSEKWIEISVVKSVESVKIYVRDSGPGIPIEVRTRMLEPFYTTKKNKGSGLGLSLVRGIAQKHGGELRYVEEEHTTFMLELPQASGIQYHH
jgi:C4-dicarboxylate-specific signal transduction histidine kinase